MNCPCKDCPDRHTACWGGCERYKEWRAERTAIFEDKLNRNISSIFIQEQCRKQRARTHRKNRR